MQKKKTRKPYGVKPSNFEELYLKACTDPNYTHTQARVDMQISVATYYRYVREFKQSQKVKVEQKKISLLQKIMNFIDETFNIE